MPEVLIGPEESAKATAVYADWSDLVARVRSGQTDGMEELYQLFSRGIRFYVARQLGPDDVDERLLEVFVAVVEAIRRDELNDPERLMGFVRMIVRRQVAAHIKHGSSERKRATKSVASKELRRENPEEAIIFHLRTELIDQELAALSDRDHEILTRFYLQEQSQEQICREMAITETQFRLLKSGVKARFEEHARRLFSANNATLFPADALHPVRGSDTGDIGATGQLPVVERMVPVVAHAVAVFGDEKKASHWLATPLALLGHRSPSQLLEGQEGIELVEQVLTRIEHNIPS